LLQSSISATIITSVLRFSILAAVVFFFVATLKKEKLENPTEEVDLLLGCDKKIVLF